MGALRELTVNLAVPDKSPWRAVRDGDARDMVSERNPLDSTRVLWFWNWREVGAKEAVAAVNSKVARRMAIVAPFGVLARDFIFSRDWGLGWAGVRPSEGC